MHPGLLAGALMFAHPAASSTALSTIQTILGVADSSLSVVQKIIQLPRIEVPARYFIAPTPYSPPRRSPRRS